MSDMREDVEKWDVHITRQWPYYRLDRSPYPDIVPPVTVNISVDFGIEASAVEFETAVRKMLEPPMLAIASTDLRIDVYENCGSDSAVRVTHLPTGSGASAIGASVIDAKAKAIEALRHKLAKLEPASSGQKG